MNRLLPLSVLLFLFAACAAGPPSNIPPQALAKHSGPDTDTSELVALKAPQEAGADADASPVVLHLLHTNDIHGQVLPRQGFWIDKTNPPPVGGFQALAGYVNKVRAEHGAEHVILLDGGDIYAGTPEGNLTEGKMIIELMNALKYDAMVLGNHEFDMGLDVLKGLKALSRFPILAANVIPKSTPAGSQVSDVPEPVTILERGGVKIGLIGVLSQSTPEMTHKSAGDAFSFGDPLTAIRDAAETLAADQVDLTVVLSHIGHEGEKALADQVPPQVTAILGGHSHTAIEPAYRSAATGVTYVQTRGKVGSVYHLEVHIKNGSATVAEARLVPLMADDWKPSPEVTRVLEAYAPEIEKVMGEVVGVCEKGLPRAGRTVKSSPLGNFLTDVIRTRVGVDVALINKTGIRASMPAGEVSVRELYQISPFGNTIVTMELTGAELTKLMENAVARSHTKLESSGMYVWYNGSEVEQIKVAGGLLKTEKTYKVATNSFLADGGDGHIVFKAGRKRLDTGLKIRDVVADWFRKEKRCRQDLSPRLRDKAEP